MWAAAIADRKSVTLQLAHSLPTSWYHYSEAAPLFQAEFNEDAERTAHEILDRAALAVKSEFPEVTVLSSTHPGPAGMALTGLSRQAFMVVVGATGAGAAESRGIGSTVMRVVNHAQCPVTVFSSDAPSPVPDHRPVVVGVDGSELSSLAISAAVEFATTFDVPILAVHGWGPGHTSRHHTPSTTGNSAVVEDEQSVLMAESLAGWKETYPDLRVTTIIERSNPAELIRQYSHDAQLVVVGSHGHGRLVGALLGSTSQNLLHHLTRPLMICRRAS